MGGEWEERPHKKLWGEQGSILAGEGVCGGGVGEWGVAGGSGMEREREMAVA